MSKESNTVTDATPPKSMLSSRPLHPSTSPVPSASTSGFSHRHLYRGALSLPDSYILLDGLTFSAKLPMNVPSSTYDSPSTSQLSDALVRDLIHNPLALALESMRGRPSLRFNGTVRLKDIWTDEAGEVYMDIHPLATLSKVYFENILCLSPLLPFPRGGNCTKRTEIGVRIALGDTDGPETTEIVVFGETSEMIHPSQLVSATSSSTIPSPPLVARVARITTAPRAPRPDDPTPRKPPARLFGGLSASALGAGKRIKPLPTRCETNGKTRNHGRDDAVCRAREVMLNLPNSTAINGRSGNVSVFKVPEIPQKINKTETRTNRFGPAPRGRTSVGEAGGEEIDKDIEAVLGDRRGGDSIEAANKLVCASSQAMQSKVTLKQRVQIIKKSAVRHLTRVGIPRTHPEFKDIFGFLYRGTAFALRIHMQTTILGEHIVDTVVETHTKLYVMPEGQATGDVFGCFS
ncbi:hypothetical protein EV401DRAFT_1855894 [Pisolithus croceorrhizus]|nr:hypothetical protein EV401DRAFT_1855894 [Pisolithus croceorrhizus]